MQEYRSRVFISTAYLQVPFHHDAHISNLLSVSLQADELFGTDDRHVSDACTEAYYVLADVLMQLCRKSLVLTHRPRFFGRNLNDRLPRAFSRSHLDTRWITNDTSTILLDHLKQSSRDSKAYRSFPSRSDNTNQSKAPLSNNPPKFNGLFV